jgi:hypothetical protein
MREVGCQPAIKSTDRAHHRQQSQRIHAAAAPPNRMDAESQLGDRALMAGRIGDDVNVVAGVLRRACHWQTMGQEIPVLGNQVDQPRRRPCRLDHHHRRWSPASSGLRKCIACTWHKRALRLTV